MFIIICIHITEHIPKHIVVTVPTLSHLVKSNSRVFWKLRCEKLPGTRILCFTR